VSPLRRFDELLGRPVSLRALALLRIAAGPIVLLHLRPFVEDARHGFIYRDAFYQPYASWYPELPRAGYLALLWIGAFAAVTMTVGFATRASTVTTFAVVTYNLFLSTTNVHNNRAYLVIVLAILAVAPCGRECSVDAWLRRRAGHPLATAAPAWPLWLLRFEAAVVYGASGLSKLLDRDWLGGEVAWERVVRQRAQLEHGVLPSPVVSLLTNRSFEGVAAKFVIATELFIALGLWSRRTRYAAVWVAVCFHVAIAFSASVEVFSYLGIAALVVWAVPSTRDRVLIVDPSVVAHRRLELAVRRLDWLARFRVEHRPGGTTVTMVDRDGRERQGAAAVVFVASRLPLTAWFALPLLLVEGRPLSQPASRIRL
jgi:vitamin K-dependent gamma-carboxylase-like protein